MPVDRRLIFSLFLIGGMTAANAAPNMPSGEMPGRERERFTGILIEHFAGHLPLWLNPLQAVVATITDDANAYARDVVAAARRAGLRVEEDLRNEKINYKVREHSLAKVPVLLVVGKKEAAERTVSIRRLGKEGQQVMALDKALAMLTDEAVPPDVRRMRQAA